MPKVIIDGIEYEVAEGRNMLEAVIDNGLDLPYFCWHPGMGSVGACRLCAVRLYKDESDTKGKIAMACMTPAKEGTRISIKDPEAMEFRRFVIEWLMTNHPHDCPVCDEGGHCHLQDMTAMSGHVYRRFRFKKRTYTNQYLGPFITHEMNRCIQCFRCVRFYRDLAGGRDFNTFGSRNRVYFGRQSDGVLESEFSGNLAEVCPTGVFTDKTSARHYTRKWDLRTSPSVCAHCGLGCNIIPGQRYGTMRRVETRFNGDVNGYWICDRGRFGYEFSYGALKGGGGDIDEAKKLLNEANGIVGVGSPRASLESNFALQKLVGVGQFCTGLSAFEQEAAAAYINVFQTGSRRMPSLAEVESADVVVILGVDPTGEAPMLDFAIRQAMRKAPIEIARKLNIPDWDANAVINALHEAKGKLYMAAPWSMKLKEIAAETAQVEPAMIPDFAREIASDQANGLAATIAADLAKARKPLIVTGLSAGADTIRAAADLADSVIGKGCDCGLFVTVPEANTMGVAMQGGACVQEAARKIESGEADTLVVLENDLSRRLNPSDFDSLVKGVKNLIVLDCIATETTKAASALIPVTTVFDSEGTFINNESRAQRYFSVSPPKEGLAQAWTRIRDLGGFTQWSSYEDILRELAADKPIFAPALAAAPSADWRTEADQKIARSPHRFSGRTAKDANWTINEPQTANDTQTPLSYSMEGDQNPPAESSLIPRFWWPGWNSNAATNKFQIEVGGGLHGGNPGIRLLAAQGKLSETQCPKSLERPGPNKEAREIWLVPRPYIYGSEELSRRGRAVAELIPPAEAIIHPQTAEIYGLENEQVVEFYTKDGQKLSLPIRVDDSVAMRVAIIPVGFPETRGIIAPDIARIS